MAELVLRRTRVTQQTRALWRQAVASRRTPLSVALGAAVALASWHVPSLAPSIGLDHSWRLALHLAASQGLDYGSVVVFTYGPLGFLCFPVLATSATGIASFAFTLALQGLIAVAAVLGGSRWLPWPLAVAAAYFALSLPIDTADMFVVLAFVAGARALEDAGTGIPWWTLPLAGTFAAIACLTKLNSGLLALLLLAIAAWCVGPGGVRAEAVLLASFAAAYVVLWLASGNNLTDAPRWLYHSFHFVSSYTAAMSSEVPGRKHQYVEAAAVVVGFAAALWWQVRRWPLGRRVGFLVFGAVFTWGSLKQGFVRHDSHAILFFSSFALAVLAVRWRSALSAAVAALVVVSSIVFGVTAPELSAPQVFTPIARARMAVDEARLLASGTRRRELIATTKSEIRSVEGVDSRWLSALRRGSVDVQPYETAVIWAHDLPWRPQPVIQSYVAYDQVLDELNAEALATRGADWVLRFAWPTGLDGRFPIWEAPASFRALVCHYQEVATKGNWQLLRRSANRCGRPRLIREERVRPGEFAAVPAAARDRLVYAEVRVPDTFLRRLQRLVFKTRSTEIVLANGAPYRLIVATAPDGLVMRMPTSSGMSAPFGGRVSIRGFAVPSSPGTLDVRFYEQTLAPSR